MHAHESAESYPSSSRSEFLIRREVELAIESVSRELTGWYETRSENNLYIQELRAKAFKELSEDVKKIFHKALEIQTSMQLKTGNEGVIGYEVGERSDLYSLTAIELEPGSELEIRQITYQSDSAQTEGHVPPQFYSRREMYLGTHETQIPVSTLAMTLAEGGCLTLVERT